MIIRVLIFSLLFSSIAFAQEGKGGFFLGLEKMDEKYYEEMKKELAINTNQLDSIKKFDLDAINQRTAIEKVQGDSVMLFEAVKKVSNARREKIKVVLTAEQYDKYLKYQHTSFAEQFKLYLLRRYSNAILKFQ